MSRFIVSLFLLLILFHSCSGKTEGAENGSEIIYPHYKMNMRKLMVGVPLLDYDYGGPNTRHDPKKGKPGGGKNP